MENSGYPAPRISPDPGTFRTYLPRPRDLPESQPIGINLQHPKETPYLINDSRHQVLQYRLVRTQQCRGEQVRVQQNDHHGIRRLQVTPEDQGRFLFGTDNKFNKDNFSIALSLRDQDSLVSALTTLETDCATKAGKDSEQIMRCLYRKGQYPTLYAKITDTTQIRDANGKPVTNYGTLKKKRFGLDAIIHIDSVFTSEKATTVQVRLHQAKILPDAPKEKKIDEWIL